MCERLLAEFGDITIDHLNGDSRETGKKPSTVTRIRVPEPHRARLLRRYYM